MERPQSIVRFEQFYLGAMILGLINTVINWASMQAQMAAVPNSQILTGWFLPVTILFGLGINLLLWYFTARKGAVVAKWLITIFFVIGLFSLPSAFVSMGAGLISPLMMLGSLVTIALNAAAVWMLFRPDAKTWFDPNRPNLKNTFE